MADYIQTAYDIVVNNLKVDDAGVPDHNQEEAVMLAVTAGFPEADALAALDEALTDVAEWLSQETGRG